jgi:hypothetical protein
LKSFLISAFVGALFADNDAARDDEELDVVVEDDSTGRLRGSSTVPKSRYANEA